VGKSWRRIVAVSLAFVLTDSAQIAKLSLDPHSEAFAADLKTSKSSPHSNIPATESAPQRKIVLPSYTGAIMHNAGRFGIDWRLVLAVMKQESNFRPDAVSYRGAVGLMQMMPRTGEEVGLRLGFSDLFHPTSNIKGGTYYLARLFNLFESASFEDRMRLALASYNAGPARIYDAQDVAAYLGENPDSWKAVEKALPLLSKRYYTLHRSIWDGGIPRSGYFGKSRQTIAYVQKVVENYEEYKRLLN
jgi:membrane-bound lytic murein transglycosylase F